jgi:hypothetical protein
MSRLHSVGKNLTANFKTTVFTVPTRNIAKWTFAHISNHTGGDKSVSLWWYDSSENTEVVIIDGYNLDARKYVQFNGGAYIVLDEGDEIRVQSETGSAMSITVSMELEQRSTIQQFS